MLLYRVNEEWDEHHHLSSYEAGITIDGDGVYSGTTGPNPPKTRRCLQHTGSHIYM